MVLDAMEDRMGQNEEEIYDIPLLDRHLGKRDLDVETRIMSKEEILQQREEMLQQEIMDRNQIEEEENEEEDGMDEETYDYGTAFFQ